MKITKHSGEYVMIEKLAPLRPGEVLLEDFMRPRNLSATRLAMDLRIPASRLTAVIRRVRGLTADTALRLARYFGVSAEFWLSLQMDHDLDVMRDTTAETIARDVRVLVEGT